MAARNVTADQIVLWQFWMVFNELSPQSNTPVIPISVKIPERIGRLPGGTGTRGNVNPEPGAQEPYSSQKHQLITKYAQRKSVTG
jgi:hypothetical protein